LRNLNFEQISIVLVLGHMANFDRRLQRMIHTTQAELHVFSALKERPNPSNWEPEAKRAKTGEIKCYRCGKLGNWKGVAVSAAPSWKKKSNLLQMSGAGTHSH